MPVGSEIRASESANHALVNAKRQGDTVAQAAALTDLGIALFREGDLRQSASVLEEALPLTHRLEDRRGQADVLGTLGLGSLDLGHPARALGYFLEERAVAKELGNNLAIKIALGHLGLVHACLGNASQAIIYWQQAVPYAEAAGDRQGQADLLWDLAILHAEFGQRDKAIARGQAAIEILQAMGRPSASIYSEHLARYRGEASNAKLGQLTARASQITKDAKPSDGPGLLRMALSAARAMAEFVSSGFKLLSPDAVERRLEVCRTCEHHTGARCRACNCFTHIKARLPQETCPLDKWPK